MGGFFYAGNAGIWSAMIRPRWAQPLELANNNAYNNTTHENDRRKNQHPV